MKDLKQRILGKMGLAAREPDPPTKPAPPPPIRPQAGQAKRPKALDRSRLLPPEKAQALGLKPLIQILTKEEVATFMATAAQALALGRTVVTAYQAARGRKPFTVRLKYQAPFDPRPVVSPLCVYGADDLDLIKGVLKETHA